MKNFREENKKIIEELLNEARGSNADIADYLASNGVSIVKRGIWQKSSMEGVSRCSCCNLPSKTPNRIDQYHSFCPNCGAEMIGKDHGWEPWEEN